MSAWPTFLLWFARDVMHPHYVDLPTRDGHMRRDIAALATAPTLADVAHAVRVLATSHSTALDALMLPYSLWVEAEVEGRPPPPLAEVTTTVAVAFMAGALSAGTTREIMAALGWLRERASAPGCVPGHHAPPLPEVGR